MNFIVSPPTSLETQRTQSSSIFSFAAERPANENLQSLREVCCSTAQKLRDDASIQYDLAQRAVVFSLSGLSTERENEERFCVLCVSAVNIAFEF